MVPKNENHIIKAYFTSRLGRYSFRIYSSLKHGNKNRYQLIEISTRLRVVQIQANLFLKSLSERVGSDMERDWIWNDKLYLYRLKID